MDIEEINIKFSHFEAICRFCLKRDLFLKPIFPEEDDGESDDFNSDCENGNETVTEMIEYCTGMKVSPDDKLPKFMCSNCLNELLKSNRFRRKCLNSKGLLEDALKRHEMGLDNDSTEDLFDLYHTDNTANYQTERYQQETQLNEDELEEINRKSDILFSSSTRIEVTSFSGCDEFEEKAEDQSQNEETNLDTKDGIPPLSRKDSSEEKTKDQETLETEETADEVNAECKNDENDKAKKRLRATKRKFEDEENEDLVGGKKRFIGFENP